MKKEKSLAPQDQHYNTKYGNVTFIYRKNISSGTEDMGLRLAALGGKEHWYDVRIEANGERHTELMEIPFGVDLLMNSVQQEFKDMGEEETLGVRGIKAKLTAHIKRLCKQTGLSYRDANM